MNRRGVLTTGLAAGGLLALAGPASFALAQSAPSETMRAEINAIRQACRTLATHDLSGCVIYTSCEPCPMCLAAIWWARLDRIYSCNSRTDAAAIGFDDNEIYLEISRPLEQRKLPLEHIATAQALEAFKAWDEKEDKIPY